MTTNTIQMQYSLYYMHTGSIYLTLVLKVVDSQKTRLRKEMWYGRIKQKDNSVTSWRLQQVETSLKEVQMTLKELTEKINNNAPLQNEVEELKKSVKKNTDDINELKNRPDRDAATKWNTVVDVVFKLIVTAFATFFLIKVGIAK